MIVKDIEFLSRMLKYRDQVTQSESPESLEYIGASSTSPHPQFDRLRITDLRSGIERPITAGSLTVHRSPEVLTR